MCGITLPGVLLPLNSTHYEHAQGIFDSDKNLYRDYGGFKMRDYTLKSVRSLPNGKAMYVILDKNGEKEAEISRPCTADEALQAAKRYYKAQEKESE